MRTEHLEITLKNKNKTHLNKQIILYFLAFIFILPVSSFSLAQTNFKQYKIVEIEPLPNATSCVGRSINDFGNIAGYCVISGDNNIHGFYYSDGQTHDIGPIYANIYYSVIPIHINNANQVAFSRQASNPVGGDSDHIFIYHDGTSLDIGTAYEVNAGNQTVSYLSCRPAGINTSGVVAADCGRPAVYTNGNFSFLTDANPSCYMHPLGINDTGQIIGSAVQCFGNSGLNSFLYSSGAMINLGSLLGNKSNSAIAINAQGWITGDRYPDDAGFLLKNDSAFDLGEMTTSWRTEKCDYAKGINNQGYIIGCNVHFGYCDTPFLSYNGQCQQFNNIISETSAINFVSGVYSINNNGLITGSSDNKAIVGIPVDQPNLASSIIILLLNQ